MCTPKWATPHLHFGFGLSEIIHISSHVSITISHVSRHTDTPHTIRNYRTQSDIPQTPYTSALTLYNHNSPLIPISPHKATTIFLPTQSQYTKIKLHPLHYFPFNYKHPKN